MFLWKNRPISIRKAKRVLRLGLLRLRWKKGADFEHYREELRRLREAIRKKDRQAATSIATRLRESTLFKKTPWQFARDLVIGIAVAIVIATIVRQMWFEPMAIPTGSMRPTFQEGDKLVVIKDTFGLNIPMMPNQFLFFPKNVERKGVVIFTAEDMDIPDQDTIYFIFPGKKRLIKRCMGKPGDSVYFYGGQVYNQNGLLDVKGIEYIPFMNFEGKVSGSPYNVVLKHMNIPIARLKVTSGGKLQGQMIDQEADDIGKLWGMGNYAMVRLLDDNTLELRYNPSIHHLEIGLAREGRRIQLKLKTSTIPLTDTQLDALYSNLYTSRFVVEDERGYFEGITPPPKHLQPRLPGVPDGRYQFYHGIAQQVLFTSILKNLPKDHPLYKRDNLHTLFNVGVEMLTPYEPSSPHPLYPARFAYFRNGDLYVMGVPLIKKGSPILKEIALQDTGEPTLEMIERYGLKIPEKSYLALGDNHSNSGDSRMFGFLPQDNLRGTPSFIFWPPGPRWGPPAQPPYPWITIPRIIIWIVAIGIAILTYWWRHRRETNLLD